MTAAKRGWNFISGNILRILFKTFLVWICVGSAESTKRWKGYTAATCTNQSVYLSNDWRVYTTCCSILYPATTCTLASPCRNGGQKSREGASCICKPGWHGPTCLAPCPPGFYGAGCAKRCRCGYGAYCDHMAGACSCHHSNGCVSRCRSSYWGSTCQYRCHCRPGCRCDQETGDCLCRLKSSRMMIGMPSPANLYVSTRAHLLASGSGSACGGECQNGGSCRAATGECRCSSGFTGTFCEETCAPGTYGSHCEETCRCSDTATCLPESGLCMCPGFTLSRSYQPGRKSSWSNEHDDDDDFDEDEGSYSKYDGNSSAADIRRGLTSVPFSPSQYSMFQCAGRCPQGRYGPYCRQACDCPAGLVCSDVSGNCDCPEGETCTGTDATSTTTRGEPVVPAKGPGRPVADPGTDGTTTTSSSSRGRSRVYAAGSGVGDGTSTSRAAAIGPEIALKGGDAATSSEERLSRGETMTLWAVIAVSSLVLLVVVAVMLGFIIRKQRRAPEMPEKGSNKSRPEEANVYEIVESTGGIYRNSSSSKGLDKLAKKTRERAETIAADERISSITKEIFLLRTSSLSNLDMTTLNANRTDSQATELFADWANSLRINKDQSAAISARSRSSSNPAPSPFTVDKMPGDGDFDDYAEPIDRVPTRRSDMVFKRPVTVTKSDSKASDRGYNSMYTTSSSTNASPRSTAVYKPTDDSDYDELEEDIGHPEVKEKQFHFTRSNTYSSADSARPKGTEYSFLSRGSGDRGKNANRTSDAAASSTEYNFLSRRSGDGGNNAKRIPDAAPKDTKSEYCSALKVAESGGEYSHLSRPTQGLSQQFPTKRLQQAPTLRHNDEDDYDYLEAHSEPAAAPNGRKKKHAKASEKAQNKKSTSTSGTPAAAGDYDMLHRQFKVKHDQYESIWPRKK